MSDFSLFGSISSPEPFLLVVDDNPLNRQLMAMQLRRLSTQAVMAATGSEALDEAAKDDFALILMDVRLPDSTGYEVTGAIRRREVELPGIYRRTPIVAITANAESNEMQRCLDAGMDDLLVKPIRLGPLVKKLVCWFDRYVIDTRGSGVEPGPDQWEPGVLDPRALVELRQLEQSIGEEGMVGDILAEYGRRTRLALGNARRMQAHEQYRELAAIVFALKIHSRNLGAMHLSALAAQGETILRSEQCAGDELKEFVARTLDEIECEYRSIAKALDQ